MSHKLIQQDFDTRSSLAHNGIYSYTNSKYMGRLIAVEIYCTKHDHTFFQPAGLHMDGQTSCHQCILEKKMASRVAKRREGIPDGHKHCKVCATTQPTSNFFENSYGSDNLHSLCKTCKSAYSKRYRNDPKFIPSIKIRNQNYTKNNRDKANVKSAARRAARVRATVDFGDKEFEDFFMQEIYNLAVIREAATGIKWEVDHMAPLISDKVCGLHWSGNLQLLTAFDNRSKSNDYWPDMW